jgi:hypothetical protein
MSDLSIKNLKELEDAFVVVGLELIAVGSDRPEGGDGEQVQGFWTD